MKETVVVLSTPRSGSSWLSRILRDHPDLQVYTHNTFHTQMLYMLYPARMLNPFGDDAVERVAASGGVAGAIRARVARRYFARRANGQTIVLASPTTVEFLPLLARVFPAARLVHLRRSPVDVISSFKKFQMANAATGLAARYAKHRHQGAISAVRAAGAHLFHSLRWARVAAPGYIGTRPSGFQAAASMPPVDFLCWYYNRLEEQIEGALASVPESRRFEITYEGLVSRCEEELTGLFDFMGVRALPEHLARAARGVRPRESSPTTSPLTDDERERVDRFVAERAPRAAAAFARAGSAS
jgi:hypothetical protein